MLFCFAWRCFGIGPAFAPGRSWIALLWHCFCSADDNVPLLCFVRWPVAFTLAGVALFGTQGARPNFGNPSTHPLPWRCKYRLSLYISCFVFFITSITFVIEGYMTTLFVCLPVCLFVMFCNFVIVNALNTKLANIFGVP